MGCSEAIDLDRSRKRVIVEVPMVLDRCRAMAKAARGDATQSGGTSDGKTGVARDVVQADQGLTDAVDD